MPAQRSASTSSSASHAASLPLMSRSVELSRAPPIRASASFAARSRGSCRAAGEGAHAVDPSGERGGEMDDGDPARFMLGAAAQVHETAGVGGDERVAPARGAGELVVGHGERDLGLPHRERAAETAAQVGPRQRHELRPGALEQAARRVGDVQLAKHVARVVVGDPLALVRAARTDPRRRGRRTAPRPRTARRRAARGDSARPSSRRSPKGRRSAPSARTPSRTCARPAWPRRDGPS